MSFLHDVDSIRQKAGISKPNSALVIGLGVLACALIVFCGFQVWSVFSTPDMTISQSDTNQDQTDEEFGEQSSQASVFVHVTGEVESPGMYELSQGARVSDAIAAAGGFTEASDDQSINLARQISDGEQIVVGSIQNPANPSGEGIQDHQSLQGGSVSSEGKVNLNTATAEELMSLDGVGEATAEKILAYRQEHGSFSSIEEIKEVSGIGDKKFEAMKDSLTV